MTLFGHLSMKFGTHPENLATEALCFILESSKAAREGLERFMQSKGVEVPADIRYSSQVTGVDGERPDIVGATASGKPVIIEAKFWAALTDAQPKTYLDSLPQGEQGVVLFIAPAVRMPTLWPELIRRIGTPPAASAVDAEYKSISINTRHVCALVSWRSLLNLLREECRTNGDSEAMASIDQLFGLCEAQDTEAFVPLVSEDLSSTNGRRLMQFRGLIEDALKQAVTQGIAQWADNARTSESGGVYYIPFKLGNCYGYLTINLKLWGSLRGTPVWLEMRDSRWKFSHQLKDALVNAKISGNEGAIRGNEERVDIPIYLPTGRERESVISDIVGCLEVCGRSIGDLS